MNRDPYEVLGIPHGATKAEAARAYRELAKKYHPDLNQNDPSAEHRMQEINEAYEAIKRGQGGHFGFRGSRSEGITPLDSAEAYLRSGLYEQALRVLNEITERGARWYYLSAIAQSQAGNGPLATEYAQKAAEMEPNNRSYATLLDRMKAGEQELFRRTTVFTPLSGMARMVGAMLVMWFCCRCRRC